MKQIEVKKQLEIRNELKIKLAEKSAQVISLTEYSTRSSRLMREKKAKECLTSLHLSSGCLLRAITLLKSDDDPNPHMLKALRELMNAIKAYKKLTH